MGLWADASVTEFPYCTGLVFACNGHFRLFEQPTRGNTSLAPIAPAWHPPPRRHNARTDDTCRVLPILTALAPTDHLFGALGASPITYPHLLQHTRLIANALAQVPSFCGNYTTLWSPTPLWPSTVNCRTLSGLAAGLDARGQTCARSALMHGHTSSRCSTQCAKRPGIGAGTFDRK